VTLSLARFAGSAAATVAAVCGLGAWPTIRLAGDDPVGALIAMGGAAGVALVGATLGFLPLTLSRAVESIEARAQAWMIGLGVRLFLTMGVLIGVWSADIPKKSVFLVWTGVLYLALLVLELIVVVRSLRTIRPASAVPAGTRVSA
jgi:hypothetical protein